MQEYEEYFNKLHFHLVCADRNNGCYRFVIEPEERVDAMTYGELKELCAYVQGVCVDVRMTGHAAYTWAAFFTSVTESQNKEAEV